ncbi:MAG: cysteine--tRNA ligase [Rhodospirillales bacterium]
MPLRIYNTLTRKQEIFTPVKPDTVGMYVCGPTVYDFAHIGNARPVVVFDVLYRLLKRLYKNVTYVRNITDVDDKINDAAKRSGEDIRAITTRTADAFHADMAALGTVPPDIEPRATDHIEEMIALISALIEEGFAYEADGHVLFNVPSWPEYGQLSRRNREEMIAGARVEVASYKKDPADFILWKPSSDDLPGWESPWGPNKGRGRPGWHVECSAMSQKYLGVTFDIHGGGQDLIFPHHENEIAQSVCGHHGAPFVRYWMHNGYLMAEGEKMSKSLGNFYTVRDLLREFPGEAIRLLLLKTHYRQPLDFTKAALRDAKAELDGFYSALRAVAAIEPKEPDTPDEIYAPLYDDVNTPAALADMHALRGDLNIAGRDNLDTQAALKGRLLAGGEVLGLFGQDPEAWFRWQPEGTEGIDEAAIDALIRKRLDARTAKNFAEADRIRDALAEQGIVLEDGADGTTWKRA